MDGAKTVAEDVGGLIPDATRSSTAGEVPFALVHDRMRRVHDSSDMVESLGAITDGVTDLLGFGLAVACLARPDGLLEVASVSGDDDLRDRLFGRTTPLWDIESDLRHAELWGLFRFVPGEHFAAWEGEAYRMRNSRASDPEVWHADDSLYAPLYGAQSEVIGMLQVDLPPQGRKPDEETRYLLDFFAIQAGLVIRRHLEEERLLEEVRLAEVGQATVLHAVEGASVDEVLSSAAETLRSGFHADRVSLRLLGNHPDVPAGRWIAAASDHGPFEAEALDALRLTAEDAWREQRVVILSGANPGSSISPGADGASLAAAIEERSIASMILAPLGAAGRFFGFVILIREDGRGVWSAAESNAIASIARNLGTAILNAVLLERERAHAENLREIDAYKRSFFAAVSHEFKGPLTAIGGHAELLQDREDEDLIDVSLASIARNVDRLNHMVSDLMLLQQVEDPDWQLVQEPVDLGAAAADAIDVWRMHADQHDVRIELRRPEEEVLALGQSSELSRVATNLVSNAVKYSEADGVVRVSVGALEDSVWLIVSDEGIGMSVEDQERLFQQFYRGSNPTIRRIPGTGLGLSIVKRIVDQHGGTLTVASQPGRGSVFTVTLPRARA